MSSWQQCYAPQGNVHTQSTGKYEKQHYCVMLEQRHPFSSFCTLFCIPPLQNNVYHQHPADKKPEMCWIAPQAEGICSASQFVYQTSVHRKESSCGKVKLLMFFFFWGIRVPIFDWFTATSLLPTTDASHNFYKSALITSQQLSLHVSESSRKIVIHSFINGQGKWGIWSVCEVGIQTGWDAIPLEPSTYYW